MKSIPPYKAGILGAIVVLVISVLGVAEAMSFTNTTKLSNAKSTAHQSSGTSSLKSPDISSPPSPTVLSANIKVSSAPTTKPTTKLLASNSPITATPSPTATPQPTSIPVVTQWWDETHRDCSGAVTTTYYIRYSDGHVISSSTMPEDAIGKPEVPGSSTVCSNTKL